MVDTRTRRDSGFVAYITFSDDRTVIFATEAEFRRKGTMVEGPHRNWRELCSAALEATDPDELLSIVQELNKALKHEEQVRRDFREAARTTSHH